jgi:hypothetical protein
MFPDFVLFVIVLLSQETIVLGQNTSIGWSRPVSMIWESSASRPKGSAGCRSDQRASGRPVFSRRIWADLVAVRRTCSRDSTIESVASAAMALRRVHDALADFPGELPSLQQ